MYAYCQNNPVMYADKNGQRMMIAFDPQVGGDAYSNADRVVIRNTDEIIKAAETYNVDPYVLAGCIHVEQSLNYNIIDTLTDIPCYFVDTSIGISQIKISTVRLLEDNGYIDRMGSSASRNWDIAIRLSKDNAYNIYCAAAYLSYLQVQWADNYDVSKDPAVWGTLYNQGNINAPHPKPGASPFGQKVATRYWYMELLLN